MMSYAKKRYKRPAMATRALQGPKNAACVGKRRLQPPTLLRADSSARFPSSRTHTRGEGPLGPSLPECVLLLGNRALESRDYV